MCRITVTLFSVRRVLVVIIAAQIFDNRHEPFIYRSFRTERERTADEIITTTIIYNVERYYNMLSGTPRWRLFRESRASRTLFNRPSRFTTYLLFVHVSQQRFVDAVRPAE